ncbi:MAG: hypothetical protein ABI670_08200 [Chloroflexota bacterium]
MKHIRPTLVVFQGGVLSLASRLERLVVEAQHAAALDLLLTATSSRSFAAAILVAEDESLAAAARKLPLDVPLTVMPARIEPFNFGENLREVCRKYGLERVVYSGGGSTPLASAATFADLALTVSGAGECVVSNNLFSADLAAFYPASTLDRIALPKNDNDLAWLLHYRGGLPHATTPRTLATNFDIDTPTDLVTLWLATQSPPLKGLVGPHLAAMLEQVPSVMPALVAALQGAYRVMTTRRAQVLLAGRVSSWTWRRLETNLPCQTRIFSEERGMRASGREERGEVRSLLGLYVDLAGTGGLMSAFQQTADAVFLDTRVLFAHRRLSPSRADRFASDALLPEEVSDPWIRELTEAVSTAALPIVLGGHSLISGGVWALSERVRGSASSAAG